MVFEKFRKKRKKKLREYTHSFSGKKYLVTKEEAKIYSDPTTNYDTKSSILQKGKHRYAQHALSKK